MAFSEKEIIDYFQETKNILFATRRGEGTDLRILGGFATNGLITYFISGKEANKVKQIEVYPESSLYYETPGQQFPNYVNITVYGKAEIVTKVEEIERAAALIQAKVPHLKFDPEKQVIIAVKPVEIKIFNSAAELAQDKLQIIQVE